MTNEGVKSAIIHGGENRLVSISCFIWFHRFCLACMRPVVSEDGTVGGSNKIVGPMGQTLNV